MSDFYNRDCECDCDEFQECEQYFECICDTHQKRLKPNSTILKCGNSGSVVIPVGTVAGTRFTLSTISINARDFRKPCINLEFTSNIVTTAAALELNFQIFKICKGQVRPIPIGPPWTFSRLVAITDINAFSFIACDCECDSCDEGCCIYSAVVTVTSIATVGFTSINNASLSAIIVDNAKDCKNW